MAAKAPTRNVSRKPFNCSDCAASFERSSNRQKRCDKCKRSDHARKERRRRAKFTDAERARKREYDMAYREAHLARLRELDRQRYFADIARDRAGVRVKQRRRHAIRRDAELERKIASGWKQKQPLTPEEKRERQRAAAVKRYHRDPLRWRMSSAIRRVLKNQKGRTSWCDLVGYTVDDLRQHIERQFTKGMDWEAFRRGEIHIDHIIPLSRFKYQAPDDPDFQAAWALSNLRPLWGRDNMAKSDKRLHLI